MLHFFKFIIDYQNRINRRSYIKTHSTTFLILITFIVALLFRDIVDVSILAGGLSLILSLPMIYLIAGGRSIKKFIASTIMGLLAMIIAIIVLGIEPIAAIPVVIFSAVGLLWKH